VVGVIGQSLGDPSDWQLMRRKSWLRMKEIP
jgi:hypothetical protein